MSLHNDVIEPVLALKPGRKSLTQFLEDLIEQAIDDRLKLEKPQPASGHPQAGKVFPSNKAVNSKAVISNAHALPVKAKPIPPAQGKPIDPALEAHTDLIRAFWRVKKGSKGEQAWKLLQTGLKAIQAAYGDAVVEEQLELAINGCWTGITLANYERFKPQPKPWQQEPAAQHPAHQVFKADAF